MRRRILRGLFPSSAARFAGWSLGRPERMDRAEAERRRQQLEEASASGQQVGPCHDVIDVASQGALTSGEAGLDSASSLTARARVLAAYGVTEELLAELCAQLREERREQQRRQDA